LVEIGFGVGGRTGKDGRDLVADAMVEASKRLTTKYGIPVRALRLEEGWRRSVEGFSVWSEPQIFVPVRRFRFGRSIEIQSVQVAAARVGNEIRSGRLRPMEH
jgi:hypothetical protein